MKKILTFVTLFAAMVMAQAAEKELYAYLDGETMRICYDDNRVNVNGILPQSQREDGWLIFANVVTTVEFMPSVQDARPTTTEYWFNDFIKLTTVKHLEYLNTSEVTRMVSMFLDCQVLSSLDLSHFNTAKVTEMGSMFRRCYALKTLDLSHFDTEQVLWAEYMFGECEALQILDIRHFKLPHADNLYGIFKRCKELTTIYCNEDWTSAPVTRQGDMFTYCYKLKGGNGTAYNANNVELSYARPDMPDAPGYFTVRTEGIEQITNHQSPITNKVLMDGQLYILRADKTYTLTGQKVK